MNQIHYEHLKLLLVTSKGIVMSQMTNCNVFCTVVCALAMVASLEIKTPKKATRKQGLWGYHPDADSLGQWRNSYHDITTKTCCVKHTWSPTSQRYLQASPPGACLHDKLQSCGGSTMNACVQCTNFINNIVHRILPHYQLMASCQNVFSVVHWLQDIRLMLPSEVSIHQIN